MIHLTLMNPDALWWITPMMIFFLSINKLTLKSGSRSDGGLNFMAVQGSNTIFMRMKMNFSQSRLAAPHTEHNGFC